MNTTHMAGEARISNPRRAPKSRNGCLRCKTKRLKCDEGKPECKQCSQKQVPCPGYKSKAFVWSTKHEKVLKPASALPLASSSSTSARNLTELISESTPAEIDSQFKDFKSQDEIVAVTQTSDVRDRSSLYQGGDTRRNSSPATDSLSAIRQQLRRSTVPEFLLHLPTMLVDYYFSYVCQIFSSFDGTLNPFRSTVGKLWDGSAPIYYAIQSMAAAYLANYFPRMSPVGVQMQREAYRCLYQVQQGGSTPLENLDKTLLSVLLVGQTTAWHDPKDLGIVHLKTAKRLNLRRLEQQGTCVDNRAKRQNEFFEQCILYWDMLAGFVSDDVDESGRERILATPETPESGSSEEKEKVFPHPWTGIAPRVQSLFAQVGRLIRRYREIMSEQRASSLDFLSLDSGFELGFPENSPEAMQAIAKGLSLEEEILSFSPPSIANLIDAGDENTPVQQYIYLAEAYRCVALLEIYRIFPSILFKRVPIPDTTFELPHTKDHISDSIPVPTTQSPEDFLVSLALHTISLLEELPPHSGTRCLQPIVIIVAASELRFSPASNDNPFMPAVSNSVFNSLTSREVDIASARRFVTTRLQEFQLSLPAKPIIRALQVVQETWARADLGQEVFWMDVMQDMGLQTIFG